MVARPAYAQLSDEDSMGSFVLDASPHCDSQLSRYA